jgi:hypothetical protein
MTTVQAPHGQAADERMPALAGFTALLAGAALLTPLWAPEPDRASGFVRRRCRRTRLQLQVQDVRGTAKRVGERRLHAAPRAGAAEVDDEQLTWLRAVLDASRGKLVMAILGHPIFAGGHDTARDDDKFMEVRSLLRDYGVRIVMAGDTHDLESYEEPVTRGSEQFTVHHWVNGGGGAYLSFGTALAWPAQTDLVAWAHYPNQHDVVEKIRLYTPWWKWPAWVWTRSFGAWPSSAEWLSAMFDYNVAPFFQSFVVVTVDPAARRVTLRPWGVRGPLTWNEFDRSPSAMPEGASPDGAIEWVVH